MIKNFNGSYIKRVSFCVGLIAFFVAIVVSLGSWYLQTQNELKDAIGKAKSELTPFVEWYENEAQNEQKSIQNLTKQSYDRTKINAIIKQNLIDTKKIIENVDFLTRFPTTLYIGYNNNEVEFLTQAQQALFIKIKLNNDIFLKEGNLNINQTFFILLDNERKAYYDDMFDFLGQKILETKQINKNSIDRTIFYDSMMIASYIAFIKLYMFDIYHHTCDIDKPIANETMARLDGLENLLKWFNDSANSRLDGTYHLDKNQKVIISQMVQESIQKQKDLLKQLYDRNLDEIRIKLKECK